MRYGLFLLLLLCSALQAGTNSYAYTDSNLYWYGQWAVGGTGSNYFTTAANGSAVETVFTGSLLEMQLWGNGTANAVTVQIDGGTPLTITPTGSVDQWMTLYNGTDGVHQVKVSCPNTHTTYVTKASVFRVTGTNPSLSSPSYYGTYYSINAAPFSLYSRLDGAPTTMAAQGYNNLYKFERIDGGVRFQAQATAIHVFGYEGGGNIALLQDGVTVGTHTVTNSVAFNLWEMATGLDNAVHTYEAVCTGVLPNTSNIYDCYPFGVMITGTGLVLKQPQAKTLVAMYGDSIIDQSQAGNLTTSFDGTGWQEARATGTVYNRKGNPGQKVQTYLRDNTSQVTGLSTKPKVIVLNGGVNDQASSASVPSGFSTDYQTMLSNLCGGMPAGTVLIARAILPNTYTNSSSRGSYNSAISSAVSAYMATNPACLTYYEDTDSWITPTSDTLLDGVHPNAAGSGKIARHETPTVQAALNVHTFGWW